MIATNADRIRLVLQGAGGKPFTVFVNLLISTHARFHGLADSEIDANVRVNLPDGGVDTEVRAPVPGDTTGWVGLATVWQYKGMPFRDVKISDIPKGKYVQQRILEGFALRLAVADSVPSPKRAEWETELLALVRAIRSDAPQPRVVTADDLATWANRYPGVVLSTFFRGSDRDVLHLEAWAKNARDATGIFVPVPQWAAIRDEIARHVDLTAAVPSAVRTMQGDAGVGKSRLVFEVVSEMPGATGLVVYALEDAVLSIARHLANDPEARAVLVADECQADTRLQLAKLLDGHRERVRVVAIDNTLVRPEAPDPELSLGKMPGEVLEQVLAQNYQLIDATRRRAYAQLAEGFPRLAADLCRWDSLIAGRGNVGAVIPKIGEYLRARLVGPQADAFAALGLVTKIGYTGNVRGELDVLCRFLSLDRAEVERALHGIHDGPGFVGRSGRYVYITPELAAQVALDEAWRRWARHDPTQFLESVPAELLPAFLDRVWRSASEEVRRDCADYFRGWAESRTAADLLDLDEVHRLVALADTHPARYLPLLRRIIERATLDELRAVTGASTRLGGWGPRRALVWLAERFAQLPAHFDDAERMLARLAAAESEPHIANNATAIWGQLFRMYLSGTATPFPDRLARLRERLRDPVPEIRAVARTVLHAPLASRAMRMAGPSVVAGRIPPPEWMPRDAPEARRCTAETLALLHDAVGWDAETRNAVVATLLREFRHLLAIGSLDEVRAILGGLAPDDRERVALIDALDLVLRYDAPTEPETEGAQTQYVANLRSWRNALVGDDLHGRLVAVVGRRRWALARREADAWQAELERLADELAADPAALRDEVPWLTTEAAHASWELGVALGRRDREAHLFDLVLSTARAGASRALAPGYVHGLLSAHPQHVQSVNAWLDRAEERAPEAACEIAISAGATTDPLGRTLRLFAAAKVPARCLFAQNFLQDYGEQSAGQLEQILAQLAEAAQRGDMAAVATGLDSLGLILPYDAGPDPHPLLAAHPGLREATWRLLESVPADIAPPSHWWATVIAHLGCFDPEHAAEYAARRLVDESSGAEADAVRAIRTLSAMHPAAVMTAVGAVMLDDQTSGFFFVGDYREVFATIPDSAKRAWLQQVGVEGARRIARHLALPYVAPNGDAVVPDLTAWVLQTFEDDDRTWREFAAGTHSWKIYSGDIAAEHEAEAALARRFLDHPIRRIREWAAELEHVATADANAARQRAEELDLP